MELGVVILNYNDADSSISLVDNIKKYEIIDKIILVDNKSTDDSYLKLLNLASDKVDVIQTEENKGYSAGNNFGIKYAISKYCFDKILISNPDVFFQKENLVGMVKCLNENSEIAMVGCTMIRPKFKENAPGWRLPTYKSELLTSLVILNHLFEKKLIRYTKEHFSSEISFVDVVQGCFFMIKTKVFLEVNLFDDDVFLFCEEQILGYKLKSKGYKSVILNSYSFIHNEGGSIGKNIGSKINKYVLHQNSKRVYLKKYLKISRCKLVIFDIVSQLGKLERILLLNIKKVIKFN